MTSKFEITGEGEHDFILHANLAEHGYHKMTCTKDTYIGGKKEGPDGKPCFLDMNISPNSVVEEFLKKTDFMNKDRIYECHKHNNEKFIVYETKNGKFVAYRKDSEEHI